MEADSSDDCISEYNKAQNLLNWCLNYEETFWRQRAKAKWLKEGDKNTHFFCVTVMMKRNKAKIFRIQNFEGDWVTDQKEIAEAGV